MQINLIEIDLDLRAGLRIIFVTDLESRLRNCRQQYNKLISVAY
ncbi:MAG: hypothetical protein ACJAYN_001310 [Bermanella sp.]|jgi:hypothetical protein